MEISMEMEMEMEMGREKRSENILLYTITVLKYTQGKWETILPSGKAVREAFYFFYFFFYFLLLLPSTLYIQTSKTNKSTTTSTSTSTTTTHISLYQTVPQLAFSTSSTLTFFYPETTTLPSVKFGMPPSTRLASSAKTHNLLIVVS